MLNSRTSIAVLALLCASCAHVQPGPKPELQCPRLPSMDRVPGHVLDLDFSERMQNFLRGRLPEQTD